MDGEKDFHITVCMGVEKEGKFLIIQRAKGASFAGLWEFPAGRVEFGEKLEDAARRELREETGLAAEGAEYQGYGERFEPGKHVIVHYFRPKGLSGEMKLSMEHSDSRWVEKEQLRKSAKSGKIRLGIDAFRFLTRY